jgi:hypothetical protein
MTLEERYKASSDNIKSDMYSGMTKFLKDTSKLNIDRIPTKYDVTSRLATKGSKASKYDIDSVPSKYAPK